MRVFKGNVFLFYNGNRFILRDVVKSDVFKLGIIIEFLSYGYSYSCNGYYFFFYIGF